MNLAKDGVSWPYAAQTRVPACAYELDTPKTPRAWFALSIRSSRKPFSVVIVMHEAAATKISGHILPA